MIENVEDKEELPILSWDVGIYNLAYCILKKVKDISGGYKILKWGLLPICDRASLKNDKMGVFEGIPKVLDSIEEFKNVSSVLIENQPSLKNPTMKTIQVMLYSYFVHQKHRSELMYNKKSPIKNIEFISAQNKLKVYDGPEIECKLKSSYSKRKFFAKKHSEYFLDKYGETENGEFFKKNKKKDDLADAYLQGLFYYGRCIKEKAKREAREKRKRDAEAKKNAPVFICEAELKGGRLCKCKGKKEFGYYCGKHKKLNETSPKTLEVAD